MRNPIPEIGQAGPSIGASPFPCAAPCPSSYGASRKVGLQRLTRGGAGRPSHPARRAASSAGGLRPSTRMTFPTAPYSESHHLRRGHGRKIKPAAAGPATSNPEVVESFLPRAPPPRASTRSSAAPSTAPGRRRILPRPTSPNAASLHAQKSAHAAPSATGVPRMSGSRSWRRRASPSTPWLIERRARTTWRGRRRPAGWSVFYALERRAPG